MKTFTGAILLGAVMSLAACNEPTKSEAGPAKADQPAKAEQPAGAVQDPHAAFNNLPIDAVASLIESKSCVPIDANNPETRAQFGVLPGAKLLSDYSELKPGELPEDKNAKLVFYCGSKKCTAAPKAASLAAKAGYKDVNVMSDGIRGWVAAGKKVDKPAT